MRGRTALLALLLAGTLHGEERLGYRSVAMFNQHLYYGSFSRPRAVAFDVKNREMWVADQGDGVIAVFRSDGVELYAFMAKAQVKDPAKLAVDPKGNLAVVEGDRSRVRLFDYRGKFRGDLPLPGVEGKPLIGAIQYDAAGNFYVADARAGEILVYRSDGSLKLRFGSRGADEGQFQSPAGIAVGADGTIYVADRQAIAVQVFDDQGNFQRGWGRHEMGAENVSLPSGIAVDSRGHVLLADELRHLVKVFDRDGNFLASFGGIGGAPDQLLFPADLCVDADDRVYVAERGNSRVQVFELVK